MVGDDNNIGLCLRYLLCLESLVAECGLGGNVGGGDGSLVVGSRVGE